ncbi:MAG: hypothetical protein AB9879_09970 [Methanothrix sp.]
MKTKALLLVFFAVVVTGISITSCEELKAGNANFDLGDGYKASFVLPDIGKPYVLDYAYANGVAKNDLLKFKAYGFVISSEGTDLTTVTMNAWSDPQIEYLPSAHTEPSAVPGTMGPRVIIPKTISESLGYVGYDLPVGATGTDTSNSIGGFFKYYPGAWKESNDLKGLFEVYGETSGLPAPVESLNVLNSLMNSIRISGPGI